MSDVNIHPLVKILLEQRGIIGEEEISEFLSLKPNKTYDPFLLMNLEAGVDFLLSAIKQEKQICIYGDYDADGITSVAILWQTLSLLTERLTFYIPSRFEEGYGLNIEALDSIKAAGGDVLVTVDCGSVSYKEVEHAKAIGLSVLVTDHHSVGDKMADCLLINPKQPGCPYPDKNLAGCGVTFKLIQGLQRKAELPKSLLNEVLDLTAVGTIGDIVPLLGENRTILKYGLPLIHRGRRKGLYKLMEGLQLLNKTVDSGDVAFQIVPHINAAGRMQDASAAIGLFTSKDETAMDDFVAQLLESNKERRSVQEQVFNTCLDLIVKENREDEKFLILCPEETHEGIAGIVAGKIKDYYHRPALLLSPSGDFWKGTGRSIEGINLYELLKTGIEFFEKFGGHEGACGFSMKKEYLPAFRDRMRSSIDALCLANPDILEKSYKPELILEVKDLTLEFAENISLMAPFGHKNPRPLIAIEPVLLENPFFMGADSQHLRFDAVSGQDRIQCIVFKKAKEYNEVLRRGGPARLIGSPELNVWKGRTKIQFKAEAVEPCLL